MILAAGRGERMRPLTDRMPKPLQEVRGKPLIVWQIEHLALAGFNRLVINHAWLGAQLEDFVGDGHEWGVSVTWSREGQPLGTAGGVLQALPLLDVDVFLLVSADIHTHYDFRAMARRMDLWSAGQGSHWLAHLVLIQDHRYPADFSLREGRVVPPAQGAGTYGNIGLYRRSFFDGTGLSSGPTSELGPLLRPAVDCGQVSGEWYEGSWTNVGRVEDLDRLNGKDTT